MGEDGEEGATHYEREMMFRRYLGAAAIGAALVGTMALPANAATAAPANTTVVQSASALDSAQIRFTPGLGLYLNMQGAEIKLVALAIVGVVGGAAAVSCSGLAKIPAPQAKVIQAICFAVGGVSLRSVLDQIVALARNPAINALECYQAKVVGPFQEQFHAVPMKGNCIA